MKYDIYYYDIHNQNILWNGELIKLIDIDGVSLNLEKYIKYVYYNLVDFIIELYIYYSHPSSILYIPYFLDRIDKSDVYSQEFIEYLKIVQQSNDTTAMKQMDTFYKKFKIPKKIEYVIEKYIR